MTLSTNLTYQAPIQSSSWREQNIPSFFQRTWNIAQGKPQPRPSHNHKVKRIEIYADTFPNQNGTTLKSTAYENIWKYSTNVWKLSNPFPNNSWITEEIAEEIRKYLRLEKYENTAHQNLWDAATAIAKRGRPALRLAFLCGWEVGLKWTARPLFKTCGLDLWSLFSMPPPSRSGPVAGWLFWERLMFHDSLRWSE